MAGPVKISASFWRACFRRDFGELSESFWRACFRGAFRELSESLLLESFRRAFREPASGELSESVRRAFGEFSESLQRTTNCLFSLNRKKNSRSMKALRDIAAVAESQPTPATLPHLQHSQYSVVAPLCVCELKRFALRLHLAEDWQVNLACTEYGGGTVNGNCSCKEKGAAAAAVKLGKFTKSQSAGSGSRNPVPIPDLCTMQSPEKETVVKF